MWDWAIWGALIFAAGAGIAALGRLAVRARRAWRRFQDTRRDVVRRLDDLAAQAEATMEKVAAAGDTAELQERLGRLRVSLARLAVLREALDEAQATFGRVTAVVPRK
jgi:3-deoxy-D-manno-octulosonic-acid transferase